MASSLLHKLLKDQNSPIKLISILNKPKLSPFQFHFLPNQTLPPNDPNPNLGHFQSPDSISPHLPPIFPNFPFGYSQNTVSSTGSVSNFTGEALPNQTISPNPSLGHFQTGEEKLSYSVTIFPNFPFGYSLNSVSVTGSVPDFAGDVVLGGEEEGGMMWADSVKKKRKKKMNKHKLKKLRKRLRRKT